MEDFWSAPPVARYIFSLFETSHICPPSPHLAEAVPGDEEDYPCISRWSVIRNQSKRSSYDASMVDASILRKANANLRTFAAGGFRFLQATSGGIMGGFTFLSPMILALAYTYSQDNRRRKVNFFIVQLEAKWLPWAMLLAAIVLSGPYGALYQGTGIIAAHLYDFLTRLYPTFGGGRNYLQTPAFIRRLFAGEDTRTQRKGYGTSYAPQGQQAPRPSSGFSTAFSSPWSSRGQGRRLGGD
ncbi:MAG: hypothetical protein Q9222_001640 [Ikaeria aurantiellina]